MRPLRLYLDQARPGFEVRFGSKAEKLATGAFSALPPIADVAGNGYESMPWTL
jgi:hypothetical protein